MPRDPAEHAGILILHFTLNDAVAEGLIVSSCWNLRADFGWRVERSVRPLPRCKDFPLAERGERFVGETFESNAEQDESNVAVVGARSWIGCQRHRENGVQQFRAR